MKIIKLGSILGCMAFCLSAQASDLTIPNEFKSGSPAVAAEVNANFNAAAAAVSDNNTQIGALNKSIEAMTITLQSSQQDLSDSVCDGFSYVKGFDLSGEVICSSDVPGTGYSRDLPSFQDDIVDLEIQGFALEKPVFLISGIGVDIERIPVSYSNRKGFVAGKNMEHDLVFETEGSDANILRASFSNNNFGTRSMAIIVTHLDGSEAFRFNLYEYYLAGYNERSNGRTRFTLSQSLPVNNTLEIESGDDVFGVANSNNLGIDTKVEVEGVTPNNFYPRVEADYEKQLLTFTYDIHEGQGLYYWMKATIEGRDNNRALSVILEKNGIETTRFNFYETFPVSWEIYEGLGLYDKVKARIVLSYDITEEAR